MSQFRRGLSLLDCPQCPSNRGGASWPHRRQSTATPSSNDPRFQALHGKKQGFLTGLMILSVVFHFLLPIGAACFQDLYRIKVWGVVNFGLVFALVQFVVAWGRRC
jgi:uncharacterized membrane protein (DUF485 family)